MKRPLAVLGFLVLAVPALAQRIVEKDGRVIQVYPYKDHPSVQTQPLMGGQNISYHGGPTITYAKVVSIFWGQAWGSNSSPSALAMGMMAFFAQFGTNPEYNVITQYSGIHQNNLTNQYWVDSVNPAHAGVTDTDIQNEVVKYFNAGFPIDDSTIYEVFLPTGFYSTLGNATSCGGPNLQFCAYHSNFGHSGHDVKYSSMPYPSCGGCQWSGWTAEQNFEHFSTHETREAVTDPDGNAWYDSRGYEADDKCAWSPAPFIVSGEGYQWEWSNAAHGCVQTR